jgi:hypothetical protein
MLRLCTADLHLTDNAAEDYRWKVFQHVRKVLDAYKCAHLHIVGDLTDKKDRHSGALVNRMLREMRALIDNGARIELILGNHDMPLTGEPFWAALNYAFGADSGFRVITQPERSGNIISLPFAPDPTEAWKSIDFRPEFTVLMHQPVDGAIAANGHPVTGLDTSIFPRGVKVYSGDIHLPQVIGPITYIGAPHHVSFGDEHPCRFLLLDARGTATEVLLPAIRKAIVSITSAADLDSAELSDGDQARIRATIPFSRIEQWPVEEEAIRAWASEHNVTIASIDVEVSTIRRRGAAAQGDVLNKTPGNVLRAFAASEGIEGPALDAGLLLLEETIGNQAS